MFLFTGVESLNISKQLGSLDDWANSFFFSVQTFTTVGYGAMNPEGISANLIAGLCALTGLITFALVTGLVYARFSRPKAQVLFSSNAIIAPYKSGKAVMFRIANMRNNQIINLETKFLMCWIAENEGHKIRKYDSLNLERSNAFMFPLNWTIVHPIDEKSPMWNLIPIRP